MQICIQSRTQGTHSGATYVFHWYIIHLCKTRHWFQDPKRHLEEHVDVLMTENITQCLGAMLHTVVFK